MPYSSMLRLESSHHPTISYRPIRPSDLEVIEKIHGDLFPIRYESEFFINVVNGRGIVSWGAVDSSCPNELIGFVTARIVSAKESEIEDLLRLDLTKPDQSLVYILTLGVVESYRTLGIGTSLIQEVIKYASSIPTCRAVYLHVISYNIRAMELYKKMSFQCVRRLYGFYFINGQHYDAFLFIYYVNGGRSPCSLLELVTLAVTYVRNGFNSLAARFCRNDDKKCIPLWAKGKEGCCLVTTSSSRNKRIITSTSETGTGYQCV